MPNREVPSQILQEVGLIAVLAARVEDCAWTIRHCLAVNPAKVRQSWQSYAPVGQTLTEVKKLAPQRLDTELAAQVITWTDRARDLLNQRNETIHALWLPVEAPGRTMQVRVRPGFQRPPGERPAGNRIA